MSPGKWNLPVWSSVAALNITFKYELATHILTYLYSLLHLSWRYIHTWQNRERNLRTQARRTLSTDRSAHFCPVHFSAAEVLETVKLDQKAGWAEFSSNRTNKRTFTLVRCQIHWLFTTQTSCLEPDHVFRHLKKFSPSREPKACQACEMYLSSLFNCYVNCKVLTCSGKPQDHFQDSSAV